MEASAITYLFATGFVIYLMRATDANKINCTRKNLKEEIVGNNLSEDSKCYVSCLFNASGFLLQDGQLDVETTLSAADYFGRNVSEIANKTLEKCLAKLPVVPQSPCDTTYKIALCWLEPMELYLKSIFEAMNLGSAYEELAKGSKLLLVIVINIILSSFNIADVIS